MFKLNAWRLCRLFLLPFVVIASAQAQTPVKSGPMVFKFQTGVTENWPFTVGGFAPMVKEIERQTGGAVKFELYHGTSLGGMDKHYDMLSSNVVDAAWVIPTQLPSVFKLTSVVFLPFSVRTSVEGSTAISMLYQGGYFGKEFDGFEPIIWTAGQPSVIFLRDKQITKLEDFKGLKLRTPGGLVNKAIEALGATPVTIPGSEIVSAIDKKIVDGAVYPFTDGVASKLYEVCKYVVDLGVASVPSVVLMKKEAFNKIPPNYQQVVKGVGREYSDHVALYLLGADAKARDTVTKAGVKIIVLPPAELAKATQLKEIYQGWVTTNEKAGVPARATYKAYGDMLKWWGHPGLPDVQ